MIRYSGDSGYHGALFRRIFERDDLLQIWEACKRRFYTVYIYIFQPKKIFHTKVPEYSLASGIVGVRFNKKGEFIQNQINGVG